MKKGFAFVALSTLALAVPAAAERVYLPVLETAAADGSALGTQVRAGGQVLARLSPATKAGLIPFEAESALEVSAWAVDRAGRDVVEVPVFSDAETYPAGLDVPLDTLRGSRAFAALTVGAANLSNQTAFCEATLFARNGKRLGAVPFEVQPMSLAREDGLAAAGSGRIAKVNVSCDQSFYPFAVSDEGGPTPFIAKGTGPNGSCDQFVGLARNVDGTFDAATPPGIFHTATKAKPKGILCLRAGSRLVAAKAVFEWDATAGPWSSRNRAGLHNVGYFFLQRFRSGTVGNINVAGPNKSFIRFAQNVNMPAGTNTNITAGYAMQTGATYHYVYTFDAAKKTATLVVSLNGAVVKTLTKEIKPGNSQALIIEPYGFGDQAGLSMSLEFGNFNGQHHPEEASLGWKYSNFKMKVTLK